MAKAKTQKKRNPQDATLRNVRASRSRLRVVEAQVARLENHIARLESQLADVHHAVVTNAQRLVKLEAEPNHEQHLRVIDQTIAALIERIQKLEAK